MRDEDSGEQLSDLNDIYRILRSLQLTRSLLTIKFGKDPRTYSSLVIDTDMNKRAFVIDELAPEDGNARLLNGEEFTVLAFYEGIQVMFAHNTILKNAPADFSHAFAVGFPRSIRHKQRRDAYRANIARNLSAKILLRSENREEVLEARAVDLSINGIGCEFDHYVRPEIEKQEKFGPCEIAINGVFFLNCALIAKHPRYARSTGVFYCGFEFFGLDRSQQKQVDRYVLTLQREAKKAQSRKIA